MRIPTALLCALVLVCFILVPVPSATAQNSSPGDTTNPMVRLEKAVDDVALAEETVQAAKDSDKMESDGETPSALGNMTMDADTDGAEPTANSTGQTGKKEEDTLTDEEEEAEASEKNKSKNKDKDENRGAGGVISDVIDANRAADDGDAPSKKCVCDYEPGFTEAVDAAKRVFRVRIMKEKKQKSSKVLKNKKFRAKVITAYKGESKSAIKILVKTDPTKCAHVPLKEGKQYVIFPTNNRGNMIRLSQCIRSYEWRKVNAKRKNFLRSMAEPMEDDAPDPIPVTTFSLQTPMDPLPAVIRLVDQQMVEGYSSCVEMRDDLEQALRFHASSVILGVDDAFVEPGGAFFGDEDAAEEGDADEEGEDSFGTNNQVDGVDEADIVKSDGSFVYVAYGDTLVIWDAKTGAEIERIVMPSPVSVATKECEKRAGDVVEKSILEQGISVNGTAPGSVPTKYNCGGSNTPHATIDGILLQDDRLALIVSGYTLFFSPYFRFDDIGSSSSVLSDYSGSTVWVYDTEPLTRNSTLALVAKMDLQGTYDEARSIGTKAHIATSVRVNVGDQLDTFLYKYNSEYSGLSEEAYTAAATAKALEIVPVLAQRIVDELDVGDECQKIAKLSAFTTADFDSDSDGMGEVTNSESRSNVANALSVHNIIVVTSFDMTDQPTNVTDASNNPSLPTEFAATFFTKRGPSIITASHNRMIFAANGYHWNETDWSAESWTYLVVFRLPSSDEEGAAVPSAFGAVKGFPINKFAIDEYNGTLRLGTTTGDELFCERFLNTTGTLRCGEWRITPPQNQVVILEYPTSADQPRMQEIGRVDNLGKPGESLFAVRFDGDKAFAVTFERIDPFYTLDLSDPTNPFAAGSLEISGFSTYLHLIEDGNFVIAVGEETDDEGNILGVAVSLFNVTDFGNPTLAARYHVERDDSFSYSPAAFDTKAFRYLPKSQVLILPVTIYGRSADQFEDGFIVMNIDVQGSNITYDMMIDHAQYKGDHCFSDAYLPSRSLVFGGKVTTMKGHVVLSTGLKNGNLRWTINLDENREEDECYGWFA